MRDTSQFIYRGLGNTASSPSLQNNNNEERKEKKTPSIIRYEIDQFVSFARFLHIDSFGDPCTLSEELWCCGTTWPRPPDSFQQLNPQVSF